MTLAVQPENVILTLKDASDTTTEVFAVEPLGAKTAVVNLMLDDALIKAAHPLQSDVEFGINQDGNQTPAMSMSSMRGAAKLSCASMRCTAEDDLMPGARRTSTPSLIQMTFPGSPPARSRTSSTR